MPLTLQPYPAYKPSGVPWLGDVPGHWRVEALKRCCQINSETLSDDTDPDYQFDYLDISCAGTGLLVDSPEHMRFGDAPSRARRVMRRGDTALSTVRTYLKAVYHLDSDWPHLIASTGFAVLRPHPHAYPSFLGYYLRSESFVDQVTAYSVGTAYPAIAESKLASLLVVIPPLPEQAAIVRYLDHADRRIRRYINGKERLIALLEEEKQAIINQAVTRGLDPNVPLKPSGVEWLGDVPAHWAVRRLKSVGRIRYGLGQPPPESPTGLPLIRATNVSRGRIVEKDLLYVDPKEIPVGRDAFLREKEIIVVRSGAYTADSAIVPKAYAGSVTGYDMAVTVTEAIPEFIAVALLSEYLRDDQLVVARSRAAQPHLNAEELGTSVVLLPPLSEQSAIVSHIDQATARIGAAIDHTRRQIELLREYRTRLISDVVTGKLDVREAAAQLPEEGRWN